MTGMRTVEQLSGANAPLNRHAGAGLEIEAYPRRAKPAIG
jgi:hypothetical protein